jgi:hypothetical protein
MTESLDGGNVTYRSNRHFDILNENIVFPLKAAAQTSDYRSIFDQRRNSYGQSLVLLNNTSHDEENYDDPFQALIRYGVCNSVDGAPMIFYGQEIGVTRTFGFHHYENNFGKNISHFKVFNDLGPILGNPGSGVQYLYPVYAAMGQARQFSRALRSSNRYYLNQIGGSVQQGIFSVAKYEAPNGSPATSDVVFAFMNLTRDTDEQGNFDVSAVQNNANLFGIKSSRTYDVKNIAAYTGADPNRRNVFLNRQTGSQLLSNGLFVQLNKVPTLDSSNDPSQPAWNQRPFEAQYLKMYDVTAPVNAPGSAAPPNSYSYALGTNATISWAAAQPDSEGVVPSYKVLVTINGVTSTYYTSTNSLTFTGAIGQVASVIVQTVNPNDNSVTGPSSTQKTVKFIDPNGDDDGDGRSNKDEDAAGTNPFDPKSLFRVVDVIRAANTGAVTVTWSSVPGKSYIIEAASSPNASYTAISSVIPASNATTTSYTDSSGVSAPRFYRVRIGP